MGKRDTKENSLAAFAAAGLDPGEGSRVSHKYHLFKYLIFQLPPIAKYLLCVLSIHSHDSFAKKF